MAETDIGRLKEIFSDPPAEYRSAPFWSWNGLLKPDELERQATDMRGHGMGGFFMHSREGLETEYMGKDWMECIKGAVQAAKREGMSAWLYDEDRWPSGSAGGKVPSGGDPYRCKGLVLTVSDTSCGEADEELEGVVLAEFRADVSGRSLLSCRLRTDNRGGAAGNTARAEYAQDVKSLLLTFRLKTFGPSEWFNDDAPADNLNPDSVKRFIETTYERYKEEAGGEFGKTIPGIFTDEPNFADDHYVFSNGRGWIPWTDGFEEYFKTRRGYGLKALLPYLFYDGEKSPQIRHDYWRTIAERFCEAYSEQLGRWCGKNGLLFTGHYLDENDLGSTIRASGAIMPHYRYQHVPGIDMLGEQTHEALTVKQCSSVANQYGRSRVLSETYGCTGWDFTFEGQKWVGDWQYALGVNLRCPHLALYTIKGCRKRDYPPSFNYNTCWWKYNRIAEDYFARLSSVLSKGIPVRDVLVLHPLSSAWSMMGICPKNEGVWSTDPIVDEINRYGEKFNAFIKLLLGFHYDFDLGDEMIMEKDGRVEEGRLFVNLRGYSTVILPPMTTLFSSTVGLLKKFLESGGTAIATAPVPYMIEGLESDALQTLWKHSGMHIAEDEGGVCPLLEKLQPRRIKIQNRYCMEEPCMIYQLREESGYYSLFIVNTDRSGSHEVKISLSFSGGLEQWDPLTGNTLKAGASVEGNGMSFMTSFGPADSKLYLVRKAETPAVLRAGFPYLHPHAARKIYTGLGPICNFVRTQPNVLTLDRCSYRINGQDAPDGSGWSEEMEVWRAQRAVRELLGMRQIYYNGLPQRYKWAKKPHPGDGARVELKFCFFVEQPPEKEVQIAVENAEGFGIRFNDKTVSNRPEGWFADRSFGRIRLEGLRKGINEVALSCMYTNATELEDCYVIGDFGVDTRRRIIEEPGLLRFGDWCLQGYFHYSGSIIYQFDLDCEIFPAGRLILRLGEYSAVLSEIRVNGKTAGVIPWQSANGTDISGFLHKGVNRLEIEVMGSPRNMLGPLHNAFENRPLTSWKSFRPEGREYTPEYVVKPYGLFSQVNIYEE